MGRRITLEEIFTLCSDDQIIALNIGKEVIVGTPQSMIDHLLSAIIESEVRGIAPVTEGTALGIWI